MRTILASSIIVLAATAAFAQEPTFRSGTRVVPVVTTVLDAQGRLVPSLGRDEFTLLDNGKPQAITFFQNDVQPFTVVVMLDSSASMTADLRRLKAAAEQFVRRLLPDDRAQVGAFADEVAFSGDFTNDQPALIGALDALPFGDRTRFYDAIDESIERLRGVEGRKVVLVFSDGDDTASSVDFGRVLDRARKDEVMIAGISLESHYPDEARKRSRADRPLKRLTEETGGGYFELMRSDELAATFTRVAQELHSRYTLGFSPTKLDGKQHKLVVRVNHPTLNARARQSYTAVPERVAGAY
jgi:Ca-activated chloride channel family protein